MPKEPSALPGARPPAQTLALPPGAAHGPLSPFLEPRAAHPDRSTSLICHLSSGDSEVLQDMLECHDGLLKNGQALRASSRGRGQWPGLGVRRVACPAWPWPCRLGALSFLLGPPSPHICSAGRCLWQRASPFPHIPAQVTKGGGGKAS